MKNSIIAALMLVLLVPAHAAIETNSTSAAVSGDRILNAKK